MRKTLLFLIGILPFFLFGQNCKINTSTNKVCLGNTLLFNATFNAGLTATSYSWNFGNAATSGQTSPVYQYPTRGKFVPTVTIQFSNATSCTISGDTIRVLDNPKADFTITTALTQCFKNNNTCMRDISLRGLDNAPINSRLFLFGDGGFSTQLPGTGDTICHNFTNPLGGVYTLVLEVTDTNNCISRKERIDHITIFSKMQEVSFKTTYAAQCGRTPALFTNTSKIPTSQIAKYTWDFGDGSTATSPWTGFTHIYTKAGVFNATLAVEDKNGCKDTAFVSPAAENYLIDSTIYLHQTKSCYYNNKFSIFSNNNYPSARVLWATYKVGSLNRVDTIPVHRILDTLTFDECGEFQIRMYVRIGNCFVRTDTTVFVYGPKAVIETKGDAIINSIQCEVHDTVKFRSPVGDHSCYYMNGGMYRLWDFDDPFAPPCTTDTKAGLNVGVNCRYSKDSLVIRHAYKVGEDKCYNPKLILGDIARGCFDTSTTSLKLTQPDAGWDSTVTPIRRGLYYTLARPCLDQAITFYLDETLPKCGREVAWYMPDSACPGASWIPIDTLASIFTHMYSTTCDPRGYVTVGLIIKNGKDKNGKDCFDTAWYHDMFKFFPMNPLFNVVRTNSGCAPWNVKLNMADSIQDSLKTVVINFGGPGGVFTLNYGPTDSIIPSQYYSYTTPGIKRVSVTIINTRGCVKNYQIFLYYGYIRTFKPIKPVLCITDSITLIDDILYYGSNIPYWRDSTRAKAGKERIFWDFGDGKGFVTTGALPKYKYNRVGNYTLRMVAVDSIGCRDTFTYSPTLKVVSVDARIKAMQPKYLCAPQALAFTDQSVYVDSSSLYGQQPYDTLSYWKWDFGDGKLFSLLKNPFHDYTSNGNYPVTLTVQTSQGCIDSATIPIVIVGPKPQFTISSDTVGCAPFLLDLKNTTGYPLVNWVWYFRDQNNATASTQLDTNVKHTYTKGGIYKIYLVGEDTVFNPVSGQYKTCQAVFPDSLNINAPVRTIRVIDPITAKLEAPDSVCVGVPFNLVARPISLVPAYQWRFGDTSKSIQTLYPDTVVKHTYYATGSYQVKLYPLKAGNFCTDTSTKQVVVTTVKADFDMDDTDMPLIRFTNKSSNAVRYEWDFGHPRSGSKNFSTLENPTHSYTGDSGSFLVCLKAFNAQDCYDSICKKTNPTEMRLIIPNVFTPDGNDINDAFDIDIVGYLSYSIVIYNRWGNMVYEGMRDGFGNDGNNWNGKNFNVGAECPEGVYFFIFKYQMVNQTTPQYFNGTVTLIRD